MAVKPVTNKALRKETQNRAKQVSTRDVNVRTGNHKRTILPGKSLDKNYAVSLQDVDTSILTHVKNVIRPYVKEANEIYNVPIIYGNEERWKSARKRGVLMDKNGAIQLPLIMMKRVSVDRNEMMGGMEHDVQRQHSDVVRNSKWSKKNQYDRFSVQTGKKPIIENLVTTPPNYVNVTYEFILWTNFISQMNPLVEEFIEHNNTYWGESSEHKFLSKLESISDASEMAQNSERFIKSNFSLLVKAYLLPEYTNSVVTNKISNLKKTLSPSKVVFGFEGDATDSEVK
tara:strand:+ start:62 stop:919 length:858 start_codon:yes stop_codon:yes gene_type:complete